MTRRKRNKSIALERIDILMKKAEEISPRNKDKANRYTTLAKKIAMRNTIPFPASWKHKVCKKCYSYLIQGENCKTRIHKGRVINTCLDCGNIVRFPIYNL
jgi:ribonuclease P protein subunit RPR2